MATAGLLAQYMAVNNQLTYCQQQQIKWNNLKEAMSKKLTEQQKYADKWETASEAIDSDWTEQSGVSDAKEFKKGGEIFQDKQGGHHGWTRSRAIVTYASLCVPKYDPKKLEEYTALDMEYDTMTSMYDALITELDAEKSATGDATKTSAQDTHVLS